MAKTEEKIINLNEKVEVTVTKKGAELDHNDWSEGDKISIHPTMAEYYEKRGIIKTTKEK